MKNTTSLSLLILLLAGILTACGGGSSDSGAQVEETPEGDMLPANFVGTYTGTINYEVEATLGPISESESDSDTIVITVAADGTIVFRIDDEEISTGIANDGRFAGNFDLNAFVEECTGNVSITGRVDGTTASGSVSGAGECEDSGIEADAELTGDFTATK